MSNISNDLLALILGAVLPPIIDLVNKHVPNSNLRFLIALLFSLVVGGLMAMFEFGWESVVNNAGLVFAASQTVYKLWYEQSNMQNRIRG